MIEKEIIKTQYGNIAAYRKGAGAKSVLLLHGAGCDSTMLSWREVFNTFSDDYSVYAFDFLGYGNSDKADGPDRSDAGAVQVVCKIQMDREMVHILCADRQ